MDIGRIYNNHTLNTNELSLASRPATSSLNRSLKIAILCIQKSVKAKCGP